MGANCVREKPVVLERYLLYVVCGPTLTKKRKIHSLQIAYIFLTHKWRLYVKEVF